MRNHWIHDSARLLFLFLLDMANVIHPLSRTIFHLKSWADILRNEKKLDGTTPKECGAPSILMVSKERKKKTTSWPSHIVYKESSLYSRQRRTIRVFQLHFACRASRRLKMRWTLDHVHNVGKGNFHRDSSLERFFSSAERDRLNCWPNEMEGLHHHFSFLFFLFPYSSFRLLLDHCHVFFCMLIFSSRRLVIASSTALLYSPTTIPLTHILR